MTNHNRFKKGKQSGKRTNFGLRDDLREYLKGVVPRDNPLTDRRLLPKYKYAIWANLNGEKLEELSPVVLNYGFMAPIRIVLGDPQPIVVRGVAQYLAEASDMEIVAKATKGKEALAHLRQYVPDVAVLGIMWTDLSGLQIAKIAQDLPTRILFLSMNDSPETILQAMTVGAWGYLLKDQDENLAEKIRGVHAGKIMMSSGALAGLVQAIRGAERPLLSVRECAILELLRQGYTMKQIAEDLKVSVSTVKTHCRAIYGKLHVTNQTAAVVEALQRGLID